jgi:hypothetical protein
MTNTLNEVQLAQIVSAVISALQVQGAAPKGAAAQAKQPMDLASKDRSLVNTFARRGFKNVVLMDRADKSKPFNIKPYKAWIAEGRVVRRGERGVRGLFHIDQTDVIPANPAPAPKGKLFGKAKGKLQPVS